MANTGTYDDPIPVKGLFTKTINGEKKFFILNANNSNGQQSQDIVTGVTSDGNATITVTKSDGTSTDLVINNVAHATLADKVSSATTNAMPDYSAKIEQVNDTVYTAKVDGFVYTEGGLGMTNNNTLCQVTLEIYDTDDKTLFNRDNIIVTNGADMSAHINIFAPIPKGLKYKITYIRGLGKSYFIPCIGA